MNYKDYLLLNASTYLDVLNCDRETLSLPRKLGKPGVCSNIRLKIRNVSVFVLLSSSILKWHSKVAAQRGLYSSVIKRCKPLKKKLSSSLSRRFEFGRSYS